MINIFNNKIIFVTGGTGSFGYNFICEILENSNPEKIVIFSRDEVKQFDMSRKLNKFSQKIQFILGDIRDKSRLIESMKGTDYVLNAAALKQVTTAENNPLEFIKTNIIGSQNIIESSILSNVKKVMTLSTDKAANPINLYGATKLVADKLFINANKLPSNSSTLFSVSRYGNVVGSRGSILPLFNEINQKKEKYFLITDKKMTRFWITLSQSCNFVVKNFCRMNGGEIFVPKIPSIYITDLAKAVNPSKKIKIIGIRPGEKINEIMFSYEESRDCIEYSDHYVIKPKIKKINKSFIINKIREKGKILTKQFEYSSGNNKNFLTVEKIKKMNE